MGTGGVLSVVRVGQSPWPAYRPAALVGERPSADQIPSSSAKCVMREITSWGTSSWTSGRNSVEGRDAIRSASGSLTSFFRADARRIYVVVTDDDASGVDHTNFMRLVSQPGTKLQPVVFAFGGISSRSGCSIAERGVAYQSLAASSQGAYFDICEPDWSANFEKLTQRAVEIASNSFAVPTGIKEVLEVSVDGKPLSASDYRMEGGKIVFRDGFLKPGNSRLKLVVRKSV